MFFISDLKMFYEKYNICIVDTLEDVQNIISDIWSIAEVIGDTVKAFSKLQAKSVLIGLSKVFNIEICYIRI